MERNILGGLYRSETGTFTIPGDGSTTTTSPTDQQRAWLESALAASTAPWKVIALHHSPYSSAPVEPGAGYGSAPWIQWPFATWGVEP